jgi:undecaprenyl diphosphate synthase
MDGNGRWAKKHKWARVKGHEKGADVVRTIVRTSREIGISHLTLYAFSTENWQRPASEVAALMKLLKKFLIAEEPELIENNIRLRAIGQIERLPVEVISQLDRVMARTVQGDSMTLNLALSYGSRAELTRAVRSLASQAQAGKIAPKAITEATISDHLYTAGMPDPDLLIRTSGEMRVSNFLLWQIAYAELYVTPTLWPEFGREEYLAIVEAYQRRDRRFGRVKKR